MRYMLSNSRESHSLLEAKDAHTFMAYCET